MSLKFRMFPRDMGYMPYLWLCYMGFPIVALLGSSFTAAEQGCGLVATAVFLIAYRQMFWVRSTRQAVLPVAVQVLITAGMMAFLAPSFMGLTFFPLGILGYLKTWRQTLAAVVGLGAFYWVVLLITYDLDNATIQSDGLIPISLSMIMFPYGVRLFLYWKQTNDKLKAANAQIKRLTQEGERQRIARDLHDTLGHTLSMITLKSELAEKLARRDPERAAQEMREVQATSRNALQQVRALVSNMHTVSLVEELQAARQLLEAAGINFQVWGDLDELEVNAYLNTVFAMCLREAVTNLVKHSGAKQCICEVRQTTAATVLTVRDDGKGLRAQEAESVGTGLHGLRQRLELVGGTLELQANGDKARGASLMVTVPRVVSGREGERIG
jgi:two-component system, NarL family, sensor histidine kinase DesK